MDGGNERKRMRDSRTAVGVEEDSGFDGAEEDDGKKNEIDIGKEWNNVNCNSNGLAHKSSTDRGIQKAVSQAHVESRSNPVASTVKKEKNLVYSKFLFVDCRPACIRRGGRC